MKLYKNLLLGAMSGVLLTGCIDDKYDLSDIDTTSQFKITDLVLPLNLDPVLLSDIIKIEEGEKLTEVTINGNTFYAVEQSGSFYSEGIKINAFTAYPDPMEKEQAVFRPAGTPRAAKKKVPGVVSYFELESPVTEELKYNATGIDGSLRDLSKINFNEVLFTISISTKSVSSEVKTKLTDVKLHLPEGLGVTYVKAGEISFSPEVYNPADGTVEIDGFDIKDNAAVITIAATSIDFKDYKVNPFAYDAFTNTGAFHLNSMFTMEEGRLQVEGPADEMAALQEISYDVVYSLGTITATSIRGDIEYNLEGTGLEINPVDLTDIPGFLEDPETDLILNNPQIYLKLMNPIGKYGLSYQSGLDIMAHRNGDYKTFNGPEIKVPAEEGTFNFLLAQQPDKVVNIPSDYANDITRTTYNNLSYILSGEGLPKTLDINLVNPMIPRQTVTSDFQLGQNITGMSGDYMFLAPLSLREGSRIVKSIDGWWSEDLSDLHIDYLTIKADATNGLPTGVILNLYAIDREGNRISTEGSLKLDENAVDSPIEITVQKLEGVPFDNLDGIRLYVIAGNNSGATLSPTQTITLENIKAKVTGNYTKKL